MRRLVINANTLLVPQLRKELKEIGWTKGRELAKLARRDGQTGPDCIYFDLHDTQLASDLSGKSIEVGDARLYRIRVGQPVAGITRLVLEVKDNTDFSVSLEPSPYRLVVEVRKVEANPRTR